LRLGRCLQFGQLWHVVCLEFVRRRKHYALVCVGIPVSGYSGWRSWIRWYCSGGGGNRQDLFPGFSGVVRGQPFGWASKRDISSLSLQKGQPEMLFTSGWPFCFLTDGCEFALLDGEA
jgi:hypothetical protein